MAIKNGIGYSPISNMKNNELTVASDFSGVGAFNIGLNRNGLKYKQAFVCDMDKFARRTYLANFGTAADMELLNDPIVKKIDSVYYRLYNSKTNKPTEGELKEAEILASEYAHKFSFYYPWDVYQREIPENSVDIYMTSPPCQSFSIAGKRLGKEDERGVLFFNSLEFIQKNKPKTFIFENVEGLLSDDNGRTFQEWINYLGGCSVNGVPVIFPYEDSVPYHIYFKKLNAKKYGVPQNRVRIFIVGIREGLDYQQFSWTKEIPLEKRLKDVLETFEDGLFKNQEDFDKYIEKYFLSDDAIDSLISDSNNQKDKGFGFIFKPKSGEEISNTISTKENIRKTGTFIKTDIQKIGNINPSGNGMNGNVFDENGISPTLSTNKGEGIKIGTWRTHKDGQGFRATEDNNCPTIPARAREDGSGQPVIKIPSNTKKGFDIATENDSINFSNPNSKTRRGRVGVGVGVAQTLDTACNQGVLVHGVKNYDIIEHRGHKGKETLIIKTGIVPCVRAEYHGHETKVCIPVLTPDRAEKRQNGRRFKDDGEEMFTITTQDKHGVYDGYRIRRLTPVECFRLMDFPDSHVQNARKYDVSDSQLYKQAGNSIVNCTFS